MKYWCDHHSHKYKMKDIDFRVICIRGVRGAVLFDFEVKSHLNRKLKMYAVWFGLVRLTFKIKSELNQIKPMWFELDRLVRFL